MNLTDDLNKLKSYMGNFSEDIQLVAVNRNGNLIQFIDNPSEKVIIAAVKQDQESIAHINMESLSKETRDILIDLI